MNVNLKMFKEYKNKVSILEIVIILFLFILFIYSILNIKIKNNVLHTYKIINYSDNFNLFIVQDSNTNNIIILDTKGDYSIIKNKYINNTKCDIQETQKIITFGILKTNELKYSSICEF